MTKTSTRRRCAVGAAAVVAALGLIGCRPTPAPPDLWDVPAPVAGDYVYIESEPGDLLAQGRTQVITPSDGEWLMETTPDNRLQFRIIGATHWSGRFEAFPGMDTLEPGLYRPIQRMTGTNQPTTASATWAHEARECSSYSGWYAVDRLERNADGVPRAIDVRFELHCNGDESTPAVRGKIHYDAT
jgi:hypothetical protein